MVMTRWSNDFPKSGITIRIALFTLLLGLLTYSYQQQILFSYRMPLTECGSSPSPLPTHSSLRNFRVRPGLDDCMTLPECLKHCDYLDGRDLAEQLPTGKALEVIFPKGDQQKPIDTKKIVSALYQYNKSIHDSEETSLSIYRKSIHNPEEVQKRIDCRSSPPLNKAGAIKIGVVVLVTVDDDATIMEGINAALSDKKEYADTWGYGFHAIFGSLDRKRTPHWSKLPALLSVMHLYDYVWWVDIDSVIMDHTIPLESMIDPRYDLTFSYDWNGVNTGSFIVRNTDWSRVFLATAWTISEAPYIDIWWEQAAIFLLLQDPDLRNHCKMIHYHWMNDIYFQKDSLLSQKLGNNFNHRLRLSNEPFLMHFAANPKITKSKLVLQYMPHRKLVGR